MNLKILLIEDDQSIYEVIKERFAGWSFDVERPADFSRVMDTFAEVQPQLVIIDIQLPAYDGFHWCRQIRQASKVPIIFLSSRDQPMDMVMAMHMGADDYIQKPFHMEVLLAKVQAVVRRTYDYKEDTPQLTRWHDAQLDYAKGTITYGETVVELTKNELFILSVLLEHMDQIVAREELMRRLWDDERFVNDNTLSVNVNRLRMKLEELGLHDVIVTKKGLGYMAVSERRA